MHLKGEKADVGDDQDAEDIDGAVGLAKDRLLSTLGLSRGTAADIV